MNTYLLLAQNAKGSACTQLIIDALSAPNMFNFAKLLQMPNVIALKDSEEFASYYRLLEIFAYETYQTYKDESEQLPSLEPTHVSKLKILSLMTYAAKSKTLEYSFLIDKLGCKDLQEMEDVVIDAIYQDVLEAKMDQQRRVVSVDYVVGRDIRPSELGTKVRDKLEEWTTTCQETAKNLDENKQPNYTIEANGVLRSQ
ncbi:hypothetical protein H4219_005860 [Mycoemilia scoparia]|uniref:PCI domain-containing protein n=1 Tax=Mycoemilia scoparia TaxID=417184 RepID=A0A9W8DND7_9FUNG|nr:hypothetical protein H4219_005860 [Mycoemilia scoparia]